MGDEISQTLDLILSVLLEFHDTESWFTNFFIT